MTLITQDPKCHHVATVKQVCEDLVTNEVCGKVWLAMCPLGPQNYKVIFPLAPALP